MTDGPSDVVLAHYGVKGMRWGKRKANPVREARKSYRATVKSEAKKMKVEEDNEIERARNRIDRADERIYKAKQQYKTDRKEVGRKAAKAAYIQAKEREVGTLMRNESKAMMQTSQEKHEAAMAEIGAIAVRVAIGAAMSR